MSGDHPETVWYIHGANSTSRSFAWMKERMPEHEMIDVEYDHTCSLGDTLDHLRTAAQRIGRHFSIISHSIGGVLAIGVANTHPDLVDRVVTMATPFRGCRAATLLRWVAPCPLFDDIHPYSPFIREQRLSSPRIPVLSIVTTAGGTTVMSEPNDGVVTLKSQTELVGPIYRSVAVNHFEVLLDEEAAMLTRDFIFGAPS